MKHVIFSMIILVTCSIIQSSQQGKPPPPSQPYYPIQQLPSGRCIQQYPTPSGTKVTAFVACPKK